MEKYVLNAMLTVPHAINKDKTNNPDRNEI